VVFPLGVHKYVYGPTPLDAVTVAEPLLNPQVDATVVTVALTAGGFTNVRLTVVLHPLASVTVYVFNPEV
jgi:hypothetical protein